MASPIVSTASPVVNPAVRFTISSTQGVVLDEPRRPLGFNWLDVMLDEHRLTRVSCAEARWLLAHQAEIDAALNAATPVVTTTDFRARSAAAFYQVRRSRFAHATTSRKSSKTCKDCVRLHRKCWRHDGRKGRAA